MNCDEIENRLDQAEQSLEQAVATDLSSAEMMKPFLLSEIQHHSDDLSNKQINPADEIDLNLNIQFGKTEMRLDEVFQLRTGSLITLDEHAEQAVDIIANGKMIARGEVLVMNDHFCIRVTELIGA